MKNALLKFAKTLMSKEQMKAIKGGVVYCVCNGQLIGFPDIPGGQNWDCVYRCANG
jgi:hypothetical protein